MEKEDQLPPEVKHEAAIKKLMPNEQEPYLKSIEAKHFNPETAVGSIFTEIKSLPELLVLASEQRGNLEGDDKQKFIDRGVLPDSLMDQCRYIEVKTPGEVGIIKIDDESLSPDTPVSVERRKPGVPCSLIVTRKELPKTDFGTIIIGPNEKGKESDPDPTTEEMVWTVHPGPPVRPATEDIWEEGSEITIADVKKELGEDIFLNVRKEKE